MDADKSGTITLDEIVLTHSRESTALTVELQCGLISQEEYDTKIAHHRAAVANAECQFDMEV